MTEIAFHFNMPEKLTYSCRLLRKMYLSGATVAVTAEPDLLAELDALLWSFSATEFVPHCMASALPETVAVTPIVLATPLAEISARGVLLNIGLRVPEGFEKFERLIEVVSQAPDDVQAGRGRWREYAGRGYDLKRHDLVSRSSGVLGTQ